MARVKETIPTFDIPAQELYGSISSWLKGTEHYFVHHDSGVARIHYQNQKQAIYGGRLQSSWSAYRQYRDILSYEDGLEHHKIDRSQYEKTLSPLMKVCALGRAAFILEGLTQGASVKRAANIADDQIDKYVSSLRGTVKLPAYRLLDEKLPDAVNLHNNEASYGKIKPTMLTSYVLTGVAIMQHDLLMGGKLSIPNAASL